jgi:hypothetical protein
VGISVSRWVFSATYSGRMMGRVQGDISKAA